MKPRSVRTSIYITIVIILGYLAAGCASGPAEAVRDHAPESADGVQSVQSESGETGKPGKPVPASDEASDVPGEGEHGSRSADESEVSKPEETAEIGSPEFPSGLESEPVPSKPLPSPEPPGRRADGFFKKSVEASVEGLRAVIERISGGIIGNEGFITFDAPENLPDVSLVLEEYARKSAERDAEAKAADQTGRDESSAGTKSPTEPRQEVREAPNTDARAESAAGTRKEAVPSPSGETAGRGGQAAAAPKVVEKAAEPAASPPPDTELPAETLYGMPGDTLGVTMDGKGWIFTGLAEGHSEGGLSFVSRSNAPRYTDFIFRAEALGDFLLNFQKQDFSTGSFESKKVVVRVVGPEEFARIVAGMKSGSLSGGNTGTGTAGVNEEEHIREQMETAGRLLRLGRRDEALNIYMNLDRPDDPEILDTTAELAFDIGRYDTARESWTKNLAADGGFRNRALVGLTDIALMREDVSALDEYAHELLGITGISTEEQLYRTGLFYAQRLRYGSAITFLEAYLEGYYSVREADTAYYILGTVYEKNSTYRNMERARYYYTAVVNDYPTSIYYDRARERIRYLDRHFFSVR